jgi:hypothetical protein
VYSTKVLFLISISVNSTKFEHLSVGVAHFDRSPVPLRTMAATADITCTSSIDKSDITNNEYTVGWICALETELAASQAMLDEDHPDLPQAENDTNTYTLARIGQHNVVLACLPSGTTGAVPQL